MVVRFSSKRGSIYERPSSIIGFFPENEADDKVTAKRLNAIRSLFLYESSRSSQFFVLFFHASYKESFPRKDRPLLKNYLLIYLEEICHCFLVNFLKLKSLFLVGGVRLKKIVLLPVWALKQEHLGKLLQILRAQLINIRPRT